MQTVPFFSAVLLVLSLAGRLAISQELTRPENSIRVATYNVALNRSSSGELAKELESGTSKQARAIAEVIQMVRPDILLVNEADYDGDKSAELLATKYLAVPQNGNEPVEYRYRYTGPVNTGLDSGLDLDGNGRTAEPNDAFGFGNFPGQYGMVVYSKFEIDSGNVRSFQGFHWKDMPNAATPVDPGTKKNFYPDAVWEKLRLSSKSHWDIPIKIGSATVHLLASHPTPPVFDGPEDRNGCRNHDEIRLWSDYVAASADYLYDDSGTKGGLKPGTHFVIAGDLNSDPVDGGGRMGAMNQLLNNERVNGSVAPKSTGGKLCSDVQGGRNSNHKGNALCDTGDFNDQQVGNLRIDYVLPSKTLKTVGSGVFWPKPDETGSAAVGQSDHRLVWIDIEQP